MVGSVLGEFTSFAPIPWDREKLAGEEQNALIRKAWGDDAADALIPLFRAAYPERKPVDLLRLDFMFRQPEIAYIAERSKLNRSTWSYLFNMDQPIDGGNTPWHCCDIPYVFHNIDLVEYPHGPQEEDCLSGRIQEEVFRAVMAFARTGNPACGEVPAWPACEPGKENVLVVDRRTGVRENYDHKLMKEMEKYADMIARRMSESAGEIQH
jgi:para-nitrobenzyl esterase